MHSNSIIRLETRAKTLVNDSTSLLHGDFQAPSPRSLADFKYGRRTSPFPEGDRDVAILDSFAE